MKNLFLLLIALILMLSGCVKEDWTLFLFHSDGSIRDSFLYNDFESCWGGAVVGTNRGQGDFVCGLNCVSDDYRNCEKLCYKNTQDKGCQELLGY